MVEMHFSCPENISEKEPITNEHFCDSCQKNIVDFTGMSNHKIGKFLKTAKGETCGVFKKRQVMNANRVEIGSRFRMAFMLVFLFGMSATDMLAQDTLMVVPDSTLIPTTTKLSVEANYIIRGQVIDPDTVGIPLARVWVDLDSIGGEQKRIYAQADLYGYYILSLPQSVKTPINLYSKGLGYDTSIVQGITFSPFKTEVEVMVTLSDCLEFLIGIINICPPLIPKDPYEIGKTTLDGEDIRQWD